MNTMVPFRPSPGVPVPRVSAPMGQPAPAPVPQPQPVAPQPQALGNGLTPQSQLLRAPMALGAPQPGYSPKAGGKGMAAPGVQPRPGKSGGAPGVYRRDAGVR